MTASIEKWKKECLSKSRYNTLQKAEKAVKRRMANGGNIPLFTYICGSCSGWHLTKLPAHSKRFNILKVVS